MMLPYISKSTYVHTQDNVITHILLLRCVLPSRTSLIQNIQRDVRTSMLNGYLVSPKNSNKSNGMRFHQSLSNITTRFDFF